MIAASSDVLLAGALTLLVPTAIYVVALLFGIRVARRNR
jgi:hypothetical protein